MNSRHFFNRFYINVAMPFSTEEMMIYTDSNRLYHGHVKQNVNSRTNENKETSFRI